MFEILATLATNATGTLPTTTATTAAITGLATVGLVPFGGSALVGYIIGFTLKKIIKWILIGLGVLAGLIFLAIQWMANSGYIQGVKWDKLGNDMMLYGQHLVTQVHLSNPGMFHYLGVPMTSGLAVGTLAGFIRTR